ncbi:MAG: succinate dehydrogenase assembly factor 2 [Rhizobiaceae bacterium]
MSSETSDEQREWRRRKLVFRSWHRGMREVDLILGSFADGHAATLTEDEFAQYEQLLDIPDTDLLPWLTGELAVPPNLRSTVLARMIAHARDMAASPKQDASH